MKRRSLCKLFGIMVLCLVLCACGKEEEVTFAFIPEEFVGEWECAESPLENPKYFKTWITKILMNISF